MNTYYQGADSDDLESVRNDIEEAIQDCNRISKEKGSRELSLVITKLEEAQMWLQKAREKQK